MKSSGSPRSSWPFQLNLPILHNTYQSHMLVNPALNAITQGPKNAKCIWVSHIMMIWLDCNNNHLKCIGSWPVLAFHVFLGLFTFQFALFSTSNRCMLLCFMLHMFTFVYEKSSTNKPALTYCSALMMQDGMVGIRGKDPCSILSAHANTQN